ncbi:MAG TPA: ABC transporter ATP-binding protein [Terricaulis sp.]|nr:ABC transporter ATP-binding protein [Terricaulis sp.]
MNSAAPYIAVADVAHAYRGAARAALAGVSFGVAQGSCFGLLGPNGAGKSTLFGLLTGVLKLQRGAIHVGGVSARDDLAGLRAQGAIAPQDLAFYPDLTGAANLDFFAGAYRLEKEVWRARVARAVEICQLEDVLAQRAETYSGGLKRRLNLAIALLNEPRVLYLDEPTVGIDARSRRMIVDAIAALKARGTTIIYTSHYMEEVETLCDAAAVIDQGRVLACGPIEDLVRAHGRSVLEITFAAPAPDALRAALTAQGAAWASPERADLPAGDTAALNRALEALMQSGASVAHMQYGVARLEQAYLALLKQGEAA